jgi:hypothetical protein
MRPGRQFEIRSETLDAPRCTAYEVRFQGDSGFTTAFYVHVKGRALG